MNSMTGKIAIMTCLAFTLGVVVGVLFHLPGTTSPTTYRTGLALESHGSPRTLHAWRERLFSGGSRVVLRADSPYSSNTDRRRDETSFRSAAGIAGVAPEPNRMPESWKGSVNMDYNDRGFIQDRNNLRANSSEALASAVIAYHNRRKGASLLNTPETTTTTSAGSLQNELVRGKILSVLQDIKVVQLERESLLNDIARQQSESGLTLGPRRPGDGVDGQRELRKGSASRYGSDAESRKSQVESSNISDENFRDKGTPTDNNARTNRAGDSGLGGPLSDPLPSHRQIDTTSHSSIPAARIGKPVDIVTGVFWSEELENLCPNGFQGEVYNEWRERIAGTNVVRVEEGCGRMQNRRLTFQDSSQACARYRPNTDQIQGEIYSYYLSRLLQIKNVPPSVLIQVRSGDKVWASVQRELATSQWGDDKLVVLTQWIDGLEPAYIPTEFKGEEKKVHPNDVQLLNRSVSELCELVQWSDLIVFDYLTANLDRVVNNMFNQQWNSQMMSFPAHNLHKVKDSNSLVFLDNESGLFHGYRLLDKYSKYHEEMLSGLCVFRARTVREIERLFLDDSLEGELKQLVSSNESQAKNLPPIPDKNIQILKQRLQDVYEQIQKCQRLWQR